MLCVSLTLYMVSGKRKKKCAQAEPDANNQETPDCFLCPITQEMILDPVITADGHTYERQAIRVWLSQHQTSPRTGELLADKMLRPNHALRTQIVEHRAQRGLPPLPRPRPQQNVPQQQQQPLQPQGNPQNGARGVFIHPSVMGPVLMTILQRAPVTLLQRLGVSDTTLNPAQLAQTVLQDPERMQLVMQYVSTNPEAQQIFASASSAGMPPTHNQGTEAASTPPPVFQAAAAGDVPLVEHLLEREPLRSQVVSPDGMTLLHVAVWNGHVDMARCLIAKCTGEDGACPRLDVGARSWNRSTPLHYAAWQVALETHRALCFPSYVLFAGKSRVGRGAAGSWGGGERANARW
jgi:hypothetical protein